MLERILGFSITHRAAVILIVVVAASWGMQSLLRLPIDAVPDVTNRQVAINAIAPAFSPTEMEKQVTFPIETAMAGIPGLDYTRSFSRNGFSQVTAVFHDSVDLYFARQQVGERLSAVSNRLPPGTEVEMGPISSGLGEVYIWTVEYAHPGGAGATPIDGAPGWQADGSYLTLDSEVLRTDVEQASYLRTVQDWIIRPQLSSVPGVAAVDTTGGYVKQYHVEPNPRRLLAFGLTFHDLIEGLERNNLSTGAGFVEYNGEAYVVRATGRLGRLEDIGDVLVTERQGVPIRVRDVAEVRIGRELRTGSATEDSREVVNGTVLMLVGANSRTVAAAVGERLAEINRSLPPDILARAVLDRTALVDATIATVERNLIEGGLLVVVVLFLALGNLRAALIAASAIPLSMLLAAIGMVQAGISGNLMSLGAIDFGLIVDGAVIIVENCLRRLGERQQQLGRVLTREERLKVVYDASKEVRTATAFGEAIIITVYIPILSLTGVAGKMFQPMAMTVIFALIAAFVLSLTFVPAMVALCVTGRVKEQESAAVRLARRLYEPALRLALRARLAVIGVAVALFVAALLLFGRLGQEFVPSLSELDILVHAIRIPSTGVDQATEMQKALERSLRGVPEIALVFSRIGTAEIAADPMPPYIADTFIILKPSSEWPDPDDTKEDVRARIEEIIRRVPGNAYEFTQPIQMRFNELLAGVRADVAVKVYGDELEVLLPRAEEIARVLRGVDGAADTRVEPIAGAPLLTVEVDRAASARYGLSVADIHEVVAAGIGGTHAGEIFQGDKRFDIVVRLPEAIRVDRVALENLPISISHTDAVPDKRRLVLGGDDVERAVLRSVPLGAVAEIVTAEGPNQISRENGKRRIVVQTNVRGRDLGSFVDEARRRIADEVALPPGTWLDWGGQFENLEEAKARLAVIVPVCFLAIVLLLYGTFGSFVLALMIFSAVPLALTGGVFTLWLRDMPFSISAAVGFIALSGVAVLNGLVMLTFIRDLQIEGMEAREAVIQGAVTRLRPVLMTALVASLGFLPMALATGTGAEVQRPLATVVIGGLVSSTLLTLVVLPALYDLFGDRSEPRVQR